MTTQNNKRHITRRQVDVCEQQAVIDRLEAFAGRTTLALETIAAQGAKIDANTESIELLREDMKDYRADVAKYRDDLNECFTRLRKLEVVDAFHNGQEDIKRTFTLFLRENFWRIVTALLTVFIVLDRYNIFDKLGRVIGR
jgi:16S rRNA G966 N2-methylase RsmD